MDDSHSHTPKFSYPVCTLDAANRQRCAARGGNTKKLGRHNAIQGRSGYWDGYVPRHQVAREYVWVLKESHSEDVGRTPLTWMVDVAFDGSDRSGHEQMRLCSFCYNIDRADT